MDRFAERGHEVVVLTAEHRTTSGDDPGDLGLVRVERRLRGWWNWQTSGSLRASPAQRVHIERHNERALKSVIRDFRPDVASIWSLIYGSWSLATLLERRSVPIVLTLGDDWICFASDLDEWMTTFVRHPRLRPLARMLGLQTELPSFAHAQVSVASRMIADSVERSGRWSFPQARLVPMGFETRDFPIADGPIPERTSRFEWKLLYVGRVVPVKGVETLVRALADLPEAAHLDIDGYCADAERARLEALAKEIGVEGQITFRRSPRASLAEHYRRADAVVFPSEWPEPFGLVPLEAMACGTPVIATGTGGSGEFLRHEDNCLIFPPGDSGALAQTLRRLASQDELRRRLVGGGIETARAMTIDVYADRLEELHSLAGAASFSGATR